MIATFGVGHYNVDQFRHAIERMGAVEYLSGSYYEHWLSSLETLLTEHGVITQAELDARRAQDPERPPDRIPERVAREQLRLDDEAVERPGERPAPGWPESGPDGFGALVDQPHAATLASLILMEAANASEDLRRTSLYDEHLAAALPALPYACGLATLGALPNDVTHTPLTPVDCVLAVRAVAPDNDLLARYQEVSR